jgi:hypothetical protein
LVFPNESQLSFHIFSSAPGIVSSEKRLAHDCIQLGIYYFDYSVCIFDFLTPPHFSLDIVYGHFFLILISGGFFCHLATSANGAPKNMSVLLNIIADRNIGTNLQSRLVTRPNFRDPTIFESKAVDSTD